MSSEYIDVPDPKPLVPPRDHLEVIRLYWLRDQARAQELQAFEARCCCSICVDAERLLGAAK